MTKLLNKTGKVEPKTKKKKMVSASASAVALKGQSRHVRKSAAAGVSSK